MKEPHNSRESRKLIRIEADRYLLRSMTVADASERFANWFSDPDLMHTLNSPARNWTKAKAVQYVRQFDQASNLLLGIFEKQSNLPVGIFTVRINNGTRQCLINLLIGEAEYRNKGVLTDIRIPFYDYLFDTLELKMILASALARNKIIIGTMLKHGWKLDQMIKNNQKSNSDSTMLDIGLFSLSREAWVAWKKAHVAQSDLAGATDPAQRSSRSSARG
jgi:RimJ/RimL family protein N-acetyltransferase